MLIMAKRINAPVSDELYDALQRDCERTGLTMSDYMRALLELWDTDSNIRKVATDRARVIRAETRRQQYRRGKT